MILAEREHSRGFSLIEIMVAMTLFAVMVTGLAGLMFRYVQAARTADNRSALTAEITAQGGHLLTINFDSLDFRVGCTSQAKPIPHQRCIAVSTWSSTWKQVRLILTPSNVAIKPDTMIFQRSKRLPSPIH